MAMKRGWYGLVALLLAIGVSGCEFNVFHDSISTEVEVPAPQDYEPIAVTKRFRFERDVGEAKSAYLDRAWVTVNSPTALDLSFVSSVEIYAIMPGTEERILVARGGGFKPGEDIKQLEIVYLEDVRGFVEDRRVTLDWEVTLNKLFRSWPEVDLAKLGFGIVLEIET